MLILSNWDNCLIDFLFVVMTFVQNSGNHSMTAWIDMWSEKPQYWTNLLILDIFYIVWTQKLTPNLRSPRFFHVHFGRANRHDLNTTNTLSPDSSPGLVIMWATMSLDFSWKSYYVRLSFDAHRGVLEIIVSHSAKQPPRPFISNHEHILESSAEASSITSITNSWRYNLFM